MKKVVNVKYQKVIFHEYDTIAFYKKKQAIKE